MNKIKCLGLVAPSSGISSYSELSGFKELMEGEGIKIKEFGNLLQRYGRFSDYPEQKAEHLMSAFCDDEVEAIICVRGGIGVSFVIPHLDMEVIKGSKKLFIGYSDITLLINYFSKFGVNCFHGPMACDFRKDYDGEDFRRLRLILNGEWRGQDFSYYLKEAKAIRNGVTESKLVGGCLTLVMNSLNTAYEIDFANNILFLEDISEPLYKIDHMFEHLRAGGYLDMVAGVVLGQFMDVDTVKTPYAYSLEEVFEKSFSHLEVPIVFNMNTGHGFNKASLGIGMNYILQVQDSVVDLKML